MPRAKHATEMNFWEKKASRPNLRVWSPLRMCFCFTIQFLAQPSSWDLCGSMSGSSFIAQAFSLPAGHCSSFGPGLLHPGTPLFPESSLCTCQRQRGIGAALSGWCLASRRALSPPEAICIWCCLWGALGGSCLGTDSVGREITQLIDVYLVALYQPGQGQVCVSYWLGPAGEWHRELLHHEFLGCYDSFSKTPLSFYPINQFTED